MVGQVMQLAESGGKPAVITYLCQEFGADPVEQGSDVLIGSHIVRFDSDGNFLGIDSDPSETATAIKKLPPSSSSSGSS